MDLETNLTGRLRNTSLPKSHSLLPLFEAVINSIQAIEDRFSDQSEGRIVIQIERESVQLELGEGESRPGRDPIGNISAFSIHDNGIGFTPENLRSFGKLDSDYKENRGGRGVGRLTWLKAFAHAEISSRYLENETCKLVRFTFSPTGGISSPVVEVAEENTEPGATVHLVGFSDLYRKNTPKSVPMIARSLLDHCLWYFLREGGAPRITVTDGDTEVALDDMYDEVLLRNTAPEQLIVNRVSFILTHVHLKAGMPGKHMLVWCADNRVVEKEPLVGKIPGLFSSIGENDETFIYECYLQSRYLDKNVNSERMSFDIANNSDCTLFPDEVSRDALRSAVYERVREHLGAVLDASIAKSNRRIRDYISTHAPSYKPLVSKLVTDSNPIDPSLPDREIELALHARKLQAERELLEQGQHLLQPVGDEMDEQYRERIESYLHDIEDLKQSDLAQYVLHRRVVIELLKRAVRRRGDDRYFTEDTVHNLIVPMRIESTDESFQRNNLWLLDERLAFHDYLASDKQIRSMDPIDSRSQHRPDVAAIQIFDNPMLVSEGESLPLSAITIVEFKKPMRTNYQQSEENPIEQTLGYLTELRRGVKQTSSGRPIPINDNTPGFCYIICDLTDKVRDYCKAADYTMTSDALGYFYFHKNLNAYIEVISFDRLINIAEQKNRAFFDKLGLPCS